MAKNRVRLDVQAGRSEPWAVRWPRAAAAVECLIAPGAGHISQIAVSSLLWIALPLALGVIRTMRRDVC